MSNLAKEAKVAKEAREVMKGKVGERGNFYSVILL